MDATRARPAASEQQPRSRWTLQPVLAQPDEYVGLNGFRAPTAVCVSVNPCWPGFFIHTTPAGSRTIQAVASGAFLRIRHTGRVPDILEIVPAAKTDALAEFIIHRMGEGIYAIESATLPGYFVHADAATGWLSARLAVSGSGGTGARGVAPAGLFKITARR
jgi:hypothetical protein